MISEPRRSHLGLPKRKSENRKEFWLRHVKAAEEFEGSLAAYCKLNGLNPGTMSAYKHRQKKDHNSKSNSKKFAPVKITPKLGEGVPSSNFPDPKWLAQFLKAWSQQ